MHVPGERDVREGHHQYRVTDLPRLDQPHAVEAVSGDPAHHREDDVRERPREAGEAEEERAASEDVDLPEDRRLDQLDTDRREEQRDRKATVVTV